METRANKTSSSRSSQTISIEDYRKLATAKSTNKNKFGARKISVEGIVFDSTGEAKRYKDLQYLQLAGKIKNLSRQVSLPLMVNGKHIETEDRNGKKYRLHYIADFSYMIGDEIIYEDFKGHDTPASRIKRAVIEAQLNIKIKITKRTPK